MMMTDVPLPNGVNKIDCSFSVVLAAHAMKGPWVHVGSLINKDGVEPEVMDGKVARWRQMFAKQDDSRFIGFDVFPGPNVDVVGNLCDPGFAQKHPELIGVAGTVVCLATLEHVPNPFVAASNIASMIKPGGHLYYTGPWCWGYHGYPANYFNISFDGVKVLFPDFEWKQHWYESTIPGVGLEVDDYRKREKSLFRLTQVDGVSAAITTIGIPYLSLSVVAKKITQT